MRYVILKEFVVAMVLAVGFSAQARYYRCSFANPSFDLFVSTKYHRVAKSSVQGGSYWKIHKIKKVTIGLETREVFVLDRGMDLQISLTDSGKSGDSDFYYPYSAAFNGSHGGCESEEIDEEATVFRNKSLVNSLGEVVVNFWPGVYGDYQGYKVTKDVTLPGGATWIKLSAFKRDTKSCTLKKDSQFLPAAKKRMESYAYLSHPEKYVAQMDSGVEEDDFSYIKGDQVVQLVSESEGYCMVERAGVRYEVVCIMPDGPEFKKVETEKLLPSQVEGMGSIPAEGEYVYTQCAEGHFTWIPTSIMKMDQVHFKGAALRPF